MNEHYPFELVPLPYAHNALEPYIDEKTMHLHHSKHLQTYVNNLNAALKDHPQYHNQSLEQLLRSVDLLPAEIKTAVINNGGGVYNHNFYFSNLAPATNATHKGILVDAIGKKFGSFDNFKSEFKKQALGVFGSGYAWLVVDKDGDLKIVGTKNQDSLFTLNVWPVMCLDVWEHAYYVKHFNVRADYIDDWFNVVNMAQAEQNYLKQS